MHQQIRHILMPFGGAESIYFDLVENKGIFFVVDLGFVFCQFRSFRFLQEKKNWVFPTYRSAIAEYPLNSEPFVLVMYASSHF